MVRHPMARRLGKTSAVVACVLLLGTVGGCDEINARRKVQEGNKLYQEEKYEEAVNAFETALRAKPDLATAQFNLAIAHVEMFQAGDKSAANEKHATGAIDALNKYLVMQPNDDTARKLLIGIYTKSGRYDGALDYFKGEYEKNPKLPYNIAQLAGINKDAGRFDEARKWFETLADVEDKAENKATAWQQIGVSYFSQLNNHLEIGGEERVKLADGGIGALAKAIELNPSDANAYTFTNLLYRQRSLGQGKSYAGVVDLATAVIYQKKAMALKGLATPPAGPAGAAPGQPAKPGAAPAAPGAPAAPAPAGQPKNP
jgi:tetratricopeptide (TPR) repeat protein